jgi:hypothetical protein
LLLAEAAAWTKIGAGRRAEPLLADFDRLDRVLDRARYRGPQRLHVSRRLLAARRGDRDGAVDDRLVDLLAAQALRRRHLELREGTLSVRPTPGRRPLHRPPPAGTNEIYAIQIGLSTNK